MPIIKKLPVHEAQKIAAGEVVERPANIVKELLENSLDAGATAITLAVEDGGKQSIQITDNGCGMDSEDAILCFEKHATSKITCVEELETVSTFGFRGEALASIAAVSKVTLTTKTASQTEATKVELRDGVIINQKLVSANTGTTITIQDLFYAIPARKKFLKTKETEWRHIQELFYACCLTNLNIHFKLISEGKTVLNCPPVSNALDRFAQLFSHTKVPHLIELQGSDAHGNKLSGIISDHQHQEYTRNALFFFVNNRWIKNYQLSNALIKGYHNVLQQGRYPTAAIALTVDPHQVDINIHPRKEEVRFLHPRTVEQLITGTVRQTLENNLSRKLNKPVTFAPAQELTSPEIAYTRKPSFTSFDFDALYHKPFTTTETTIPAMELTQQPPMALHHKVATDTITATESSLQESVTGTTPETEHYTLIGQLHNTYILLDQPNGLFVVDQHAAHERILYERFAQRFHEVPTITLLFPQIIALTQEDMAIIEPHLDIFITNSISIERFSPNQLIIHATPVHLKDVSLTELVHQVIGWVQEFSALDKTQFFKTINEKLHAQMACKAAIKAGDPLTKEKMEQLLTDLQKTPNRFTCPHGRPTGWLLTSYEIEKKFKRKV